MELAEKYNIKDYPSPAGGCKLTEPNFAFRLKRLLQKNQNSVTVEEIKLLDYGRHFATPNGTEVIVTRTGEEAEAVKKILTKEHILFIPSSHMGAMGIIYGVCSEADKEFACKIVARYSKGKDLDSVKVKYGNYGTKFSDELAVKPATQEEIDAYIIQSK